MKKFPFTPQGAAALQEALYLKDEPELMAEGLAIAADFLSWTASRFELDVSLFEALRNLSATVRLQSGWCLASCVIARKPFILGNLCSTEITENFSFAFSLSFAESDGAGELTGRMRITIPGSI